jgi:hypothetical protein
VKPPWTINIHFFKNEGQEDKTGLSQECLGKFAVHIEFDGHMEGVNECEYGRCILYS